VAYFAVIEENGPGFDPARGRREQDGWDGHAKFMDDLTDEGFVLVAGPLEDERILLIVEAADADEVRSRFATDPWAPADVVRVVSVTRWDVWLGAARLSDS
jgi:uncharacterized protein YciI